MRDDYRRVRKYELMVIFSPDLSEEDLPGAIERVGGYVTTVGGSVAGVNRDSPWGRRRLAYPIRHEGRDLRDGYYVLYYLELDTERVIDVEREIKLNVSIMRYLVTLQTAPMPEPAAEEPATEAPAVTATGEPPVQAPAETPTEAPAVAEAEAAAPVEAPTTEEPAIAAEPETVAAAEPDVTEQPSESAAPEPAAEEPVAEPGTAFEEPAAISDSEPADATEVEQAAVEAAPETPAVEQAVSEAASEPPASDETAAPAPEPVESADAAEQTNTETETEAGSSDEDPAADGDPETTKEG